MAEVPEHLLKRSEERRKALAAAAGAEAAASGEALPENDAVSEPAEVGAPESGAIEAAAAGSVESAAAVEAPAESKGGVPAHLLERARKRKEALAAGEGGEAAASAPGGGAQVAAASAIPAPTATGAGGHTQRLLAVVKSGSIQQVKSEPTDKVHTWPHLLVMEFAALLTLSVLLIIFSAVVRAPLLGLADFNRTPNPSKAPWYFLGLQELLTMFHPMVAGVTIPGVALVVLGATPYYDKNPSNKPNDRKFAICMFTLFLIFWAVLVIIGSFFRGEGFNFTFPWNNGVFFDL